jgi:hypothetical protein
VNGQGKQINLAYMSIREILHRFEDHIFRLNVGQGSNESSHPMSIELPFIQDLYRRLASLEEAVNQK